MKAPSANFTDSMAMRIGLASAIDEAAVPAPAAEVLRPFFRQVAEFLINR